jgi:sulfur transfer complex TusBCD TusB component (DsrH family)
MLIGDESVIATYAVAQALNARQITRQINQVKVNLLRVESLG